MLSDFVRAKFLVIAVLIALFAGLALFSADYSFRDAGRTGSQNCFIRVYDRCYRLKEAQRLAQFYQLAQELILFEFAASLFGEERLDTDVTDFVMGLIVLRKEAKRLGVEPTEEEVARAVPNLPRFQFSTNIDEEYVVDNLLGPRGLSKGDFYQLVKDYLSWQRIQDLLAAGLRVPQSEIDKTYVRDFQRFSASLVEFERGDFLEKVEITDADLQAYYDANKDSLLTEEKRAFTSVRFAPPEPAEGSTEEQKAIQLAEFPNLVNKIYSELAKDPASFDITIAATIEEAKDEASKSEMGPIEFKTLEAFPSTSPPEALKEKAGLVGGLFSPSLTVARPVTLPFEQKDGSYLILKLNETLPPKAMTFEEANEQIRTAVKGEKSDQLVKEAANAARGKIAEELEAGKSIKDAALAAGVELLTLDPFSKKEPPKGIDNPNSLVVAALKLQPNSVSEVVPRPLGKGYHLLLVEKIELVKDDGADQEKLVLRSSANSEFRRALFRAWFNRVRNASGAERTQSIPTRQAEDAAPPPGPQPVS